jgi:hypothetical protein
MSRFVSGTLTEIGVFMVSLERVSVTGLDTFSEKVGVTGVFGDNMGFEGIFFIPFLSFVHNQ